jgi:hypothetical protein
MSVDAGVTRCASQVLVFPVWDVLVRSSVAVFLGKTEVDDVDQIPLLS